MGEILRCDFSRYPNVSRWLAAMKSRKSWPKVHEAFDGLVASVKTTPFVAI